MAEAAAAGGAAHPKGVWREATAGCEDATEKSGGGSWLCPRPFEPITPTNHSP